MVKVITKYYALTSVKGPEEQVGLIFEVDSTGRLEELTNFLHVSKVRGGKTCSYQANINVDKYGKSLGSPDYIRLKVKKDASLVIAKQPSYAMQVKAVSRKEALVRAMQADQVRREGLEKSITVISGANPTFGLPPVVYKL
ncbi:MAG: hypothetical protein QW404_02980 [Candidatus Nanoarchaeia archaeon]